MAQRGINLQRYPLPIETRANGARHRPCVAALRRGCWCRWSYHEQPVTAACEGRRHRNGSGEMLVTARVSFAIHLNALPINDAANPGKRQCQRFSQAVQ